MTSIRRFVVRLLFVVGGLSAWACSDGSAAKEEFGTTLSDESARRIAESLDVLARFYDDSATHPERLGPVEASLRARLGDADANTILQVRNTLALWREGLGPEPQRSPETDDLLRRLGDLPYFQDLAAIWAPTNGAPPAASTRSRSEQLGVVRQPLSVPFQPRCHPPGGLCSDQALAAIAKAVGRELLGDMLKSKLVGVVVDCVKKGARGCDVASLADEVAEVAAVAAFPEVEIVLEAMTLLAIAADAGKAWPTLTASCDEFQKSAECTCPPPLAVCGGRCVDLSSSYFHCGFCEGRCDGHQTCTAGRCVDDRPKGVDAGANDASDAASVARKLALSMTATWSVTPNPQGASCYWTGTKSGTFGELLTPDPATGPDSYLASQPKGQPFQATLTSVCPDASSTARVETIAPSKVEFYGAIDGLQGGLVLSLTVTATNTPNDPQFPPQTVGYMEIVTLHAHRSSVDQPFRLDGSMDMATAYANNTCRRTTTVSTSECTYGYANTILTVDGTLTPTP